MMDIDKKKLKEQEIRTLFITPALNKSGWEVLKNMREEFYFTDGRVFVAGSQHSVGEGKKADYLLYHNGRPIAVVEAKDNNHAVGGGIQQAMDYALILDLKFAYSSNGDVLDSNNHKLGSIDSWGTVKDRNGHTLGHANGVERVFAAVFFFFDF